VVCLRERERERESIGRNDGPITSLQKHRCTIGCEINLRGGGRCGCCLFTVFQLRNVNAKKNKNLTHARYIINVPFDKEYNTQRVRRDIIIMMMGWFIYISINAIV